MTQVKWFNKKYKENHRMRKLILKINHAIKTKYKNMILDQTPMKLLLLIKSKNYFDLIKINLIIYYLSFNNNKKIPIMILFWIIY